MSNTYFYRPNKDAGNAFVQALNNAGYRRTDNINSADFLLMDHDDIRYQPEYKNAMATKLIFIYPHVPYSWFIWDGILEAKSIACNFVVSDGAKEAMRLYGYPYRVESVGFAGMDVQSFQPTHGTKLLFAPAHPLNDGRYPTELGLQRTREAAKWIVRHLHYFESINIRWHGKSLQSVGLGEFEGIRASHVHFQNINVYHGSNIRQDALAAIGQADLVISQATFAYLAVASGKPTVFYGCDWIPDTREGNAKHPELYKHIWAYPFVLEEMDIEKVLDMRTREMGALTNWKQLNLGSNFNAEKFLSIIREYVS